MESSVIQSVIGSEDRGLSSEFALRDSKQKKYASNLTTLLKLDNTSTVRKSRAASPMKIFVDHHGNNREAIKLQSILNRTDGP